MKIKQFFLMAALGLMATTTLTSCEDILGEWDKPTPTNVTPSGGDDDGGSTPATIPGLLAGKFTINAGGDQIQFSQGNLQYTKSTGVWSFMDYQWSTVETNGDVGADYASQDVVSLFGWVGESSTTLTSDLAKYGISTSTTSSDYGTKKGSEGETLKSDWGTLTISNGGNTPNYGWRTLNKDEWTYLFNTRPGATVKSTANVRCTMATINTDATAVKGMILFPDGKEFADTEATWGTLNNYSDYTTQCTSAQWTALADKGCVFLPAAGCRDGSAVNGAGTYGDYWSSSPNGSGADDAYSVYFDSGHLDPADNDGRNNGFSVRLVRPAE